MIKDSKRARSVKTTIACMAIAVLLLAICGLLFNRIVQIEQDQIELAHNDIKLEKCEQIYLLLDILLDQAYDNASTTSFNIENDIENSDLDSIKEDLTLTNTSEDLQRIFRKNIEGIHLNDINNSRNGIIILNRDGVVEDLNYSRTGNLSRSWKCELEHTYNKALLEDAIDKINTHSNEIIAVEYEPSSVENHIMVEELSKDTIREVFMKEGLEGLKNYQILVPVYITETGDIFGQEDIVQGVAQKNYKFIVVQEFNLYDQIMENEEVSIYNYDRLETLDNNYCNIINLYYILGIVFVITVVILLSVFVLMYNNFIAGYLNAMYDDLEFDLGNIKSEEKDE